MQRKIIYKAILAFVYQILIITSFYSSVFAKSKKDEMNLKFLNKINFSDEIGLIKEKFIVGDMPDKFIVYIQDAHCNYEAQMNIAKMIKLLVEEYGFNLINVEGTAGLIDTKPFSTFKDRKVKMDFAEYFMKQGKITGPEYLSITSDLEFIIYGIEDEDLYAENYTAYMNALEFRDSVNAYAARIKEKLNSIKKSIFSEDLQRIDTKARRHEMKILEFMDYVIFLEEFCKEFNIDLSSFPNFILQAKARILEDEIDFEKIEESRSALIEKLNETLADNQEAVRTIVQQSFSYKMMEISAKTYYGFLCEEAEKNGINLEEEFSTVKKYNDYLIVYNAMDKSKIVDEVVEMEYYIKDKLYKNDKERKLDSICRVVSILDRLFKLEVVRSEYVYYKKNKKEFGFDGAKKFILQEGPALGVYLDFNVDTALIQENIHWVEGFYEAAIKRDLILVENSIAQMEERGEDRSVLITGGFHSEGMVRILKEKKTSFYLVAPRILNPNAETPYEDVMRSQADSVKGYQGIKS